MSSAVPAVSKQMLDWRRLLGQVLACQVADEKPYGLAVIPEPACSLTHLFDSSLIYATNPTISTGRNVSL